MAIKQFMTLKDSISVEDNGTITLPTGVSGMLKVWTEAQYGEFYIDASGVCTLIYGSANVTNTDTDNYLCVYDGGTGGVIKNALGSTKTVRYVFQYS